MQATLTLDAGRAVIALVGNFTYEAHREFKQVTTAAVAAEGVTELDIDFDQVVYMDSAALGMLLLLNERAAGRKIKLSNCRGTVKSVLDIANFGKIFQIN
ncbi:anti-anti-sigma factor [Andreprevotia lacus DSM 23236]|jgi:anti-anti-sigma factor|uniref:Anti-anti-sigma factor n=1 Tax=Andreprevotia lacus DSM 23236 TaxID=1121001 RepID=A0A1W1X1X8_9NEIS|nr:STAS domain-containing protein [Andreprevotia lacus]SMC17897.1 anti-anti-sigma factor [Andreprevotia lacus DSM 23236]